VVAIRRSRVRSSHRTFCPSFASHILPNSLGRPVMILDLWNVSVRPFIPPKPIVVVSVCTPLSPVVVGAVDYPSISEFPPTCRRSKHQTVVFLRTPYQALAICTASPSRRTRISAPFSPYPASEFRHGPASPDGTIGLELSSRHLAGRRPSRRRSLKGKVTTRNRLWLAYIHTIPSPQAPKPPSYIDMR
jgi:hypothetical protein